MSVSSTEIEDAGKAPKRVTTDEGTVEEKPVEDLINAANRSAAAAVGDVPLHGLRISRFKPSGAV